MTAYLRKVLDAGKRALEYAKQRIIDDASYTVAVNELDVLMARAAQLEQQQINGVAMQQAAATRRRELRQDVIRGLMKHLATAASIMHPKASDELLSALVLPKRSAPYQTFIAAARAMLAAALPVKDALLKAGIGDKFFDEFSQAVAEFDDNAQATHSGARDHVGASADLDEVGRAVLKQLRLLDGLFRMHYRNDAENLATWESARNVVGPTRSRHSDAPVQGNGAIPASAIPLSPAASGGASEGLGVH